MLVLAAAVLVVSCSCSGHSRSALPPVPTSDQTAVTPGHGPGGSVLEARPLRVPTVAAGAACPMTTTWTRAAAIGFSSSYGARPVLGRGPVFPLGPWPYPFARQAVGNATPRSDSGPKVLWAEHGYPGLVLIRGRQVDGTGQLRFQQGDPGPITPQLWLPAQPRPSAFATATVVPHPGCYAWQVDGLGFSEVIVFDAPAAVPALQTVHLTRCGIAPINRHGTAWFVPNPPFTAADPPTNYSGQGTFIRQDASTATFHDVGGAKITFSTTATACA